ncbi:MAG: NACHT domain-containing protein [Planctomycetes bacterium]|nr:NACHT domain-containing protein [Planctomycetota bacterium]
MPKAQPAEIATKDRVLAALRLMSERQLRETIVIPLLKAMGATHLEHVHGPFERGKDFIFVMPDSFRDPILSVIQVKNSEFSGSFSSESSVSTALQQLLHCAETKVLSPLTNQKELPKEVLFITTYNLPDAPLADADLLLDKVRRQSKIIGPEKLVALIHDCVPELYATLAYPGTSLSTATRAYVSLHREWHAFELAQQRPLESFYVNLSASPVGGDFGSLLSGKLQLSGRTGFTIRRDDFNAIQALYCQVPKLHTVPPLLDPIKSRYSGANSKTKSSSATSEAESTQLLEDVSFRRPNLAAFIEKLQERISGAEAAKDCALIDDIAVSGAVVNSLVRVCDKDMFVPSSDETSPRALVIPDVCPDVLVSAENHIAIVADAGSGKTCFAQRLADAAIEKGISCIYFPCSRIESPDTSLFEALDAFLQSLKATDPGVPIADVLSATQLVIIDGADEAATFGPALGKQILAMLHIPKEVRVDGSYGRECRVPTEFHDVILLRDDTKKKGCHLGISRPIRAMDYRQLSAMNAGTPFETAFETLRSEAASKSPRLIITSRDIANLQLPAIWAVTNLLPFTEEQLDAFMNKWFELSPTKLDEIRVFFGKNSHIRAVCANPMTATIVASLHENDFGLPHSRAEVYERRFELLLERWDRQRQVKRPRRIVKSDKRHFLKRLAYSLHLKHRRRFDKRTAAKIWNASFAKTYENLAIEDVIDELRLCDSIIVPEGVGEYSLGHLSYQEYLTAEHVVSGQQLEVLVDNFHDPWWRNVILFHAGITGNVNKLLTQVHRRYPLGREDDLLDEMMLEARYTPEVVRQLVEEFREDENVTCDNDEN